MGNTPIQKAISLFLLFVAAFIVLGVTALAKPNCFGPPVRQPGDRGNTTIVSLKDFTRQEVKGIGITLTKDITVHISGVGGADESFWQDAFGDNESQPMYAAGWIIDANTRQLVWDMTTDNTTGRSSRRTCEKDLTLKKGSYEVYFEAYGYASGGSFSHFSMNIDRRESRHSSSRVWGGLLNLLGADFDDRYDEFMNYAKDRWGITLTVPEGEASDVATFSAPLRREDAIITETSLGDNVTFHRTLEVSKDVPVHIYAIGEGQDRENVVDFGWIVNAETRQRVWDMSQKGAEYAGGAKKNFKFDRDVDLPKGTYELWYVTDGSHSNDDWNARPPYDPFNYGITVTLNRPEDKGAIKVSDRVTEDRNVIVKLTEVGDDDYRSAGFSLARETPVRIYALGESENNNEDMADYGWIVNTKTRERVWTMDRDRTYHAGGAAKNRLADEIVTLPKGSYTVFYQTDGSHSYNQWNADAPFDPEHWGITVMGVGKGFTLSDVSTFSEEKEQGVIAQLIKVRDDEHERQRFAVPAAMKVRVYALGESDGDEMADYGWIENAETGQRVWEMEYDKTSWAGGARKNRVFDRVITLEKGEYEVHFRTDGSHAFNDWNDDPPEDRTHWGITLYRSQ